MGILQKADRCMDEAAALFGENKLFLAEKKAQETAGLYKSCGAYEQMEKLQILQELRNFHARNIILQQVILRKLMEHITLLMAVWIEHIPA